MLSLLQRMDNGLRVSPRRFQVQRPQRKPMSRDRLSILYVSHMPASPPRFGAQARVHGLMTQLARRHELSAVMLVDDEFDSEAVSYTHLTLPTISSV